MCKEASLGLSGYHHSLFLSLDKHMPQGPIRHLILHLGLFLVSSLILCLQILHSPNIGPTLQRERRKGRRQQRSHWWVDVGNSSIKLRVRNKAPDLVWCLSLNSLRLVWVNQLQGGGPLAYSLPIYPALFTCTVTEQMSDLYLYYELPGRLCRDIPAWRITRCHCWRRHTPRESPFCSHTLSMSSWNH